MKSAISSDPDIMGGAAVFNGTRVPFRTLLDHLGNGASLDEFLDDFPSVTRELAVAGLSELGDEVFSSRIA